MKRISTPLIVAVLLGVLAMDLSRAATWTIHPDGSGDYPTIQAAIDAAVDGDVIELGAGVFTGVGNRSIQFSGKAVTLRSINGNPQTCVIDAEGQGFCVRLGSDSGPASVEAVTLTGGLSSGIICNGEATIRGCVVRDNVSKDGFGGGIQADGAAVTIEDCWILENRTSGHSVGGGGIACGRGSRVVRTVVAGNRSANGGGIFSRGDVIIEECLVAGNEAESGGGISTSSTSEGTVTITRTTVAANRATGDGGGIRAARALLIEASIIWANCADGQSDGVHNTSTVGIQCSNVLAEELGGAGVYALGDDNLEADPLFCGGRSCAEAPTTEGDFTLDGASPCLPEGNSCGQRMGAYGLGCQGPTPARLSSWGRLKSRFGEATR